MPDRPPRLIDLRVDWFAQYAGEAPPFDRFPPLPGRLGQLDGYLGATSAAFLAIDAALIPRAEAEFAGRLLAGPEDYRRWLDDPDGLTWAVLEIEGGSDLPGLFRRGVRSYRPLDGFKTHIGTLINLSEPGARPIVDLSGLGVEALDWFEADASRPDALVPLWGRGPVDAATAARVRALGGFVAVALGGGTVDTIRERIVAAGGPEHVVLATGFLGSDDTTAGMADAPAVIKTVMDGFDDAARLLFENGKALIERSVGGK